MEHYWIYWIIGMDIAKAAIIIIAVKLIFSSATKRMEKRMDKRADKHWEAWLAREETNR